MSGDTPDPANIQANILRGSSKWTWAAYVFVQITNCASGEALVEGLLASGHVGTAASTAAGAPAVNINIAFSHAGLKKVKKPLSDASRYKRDFLMRLQKTEPEPLAEDGQRDSEPQPGSAFERGMYSARLDDAWPQRYGSTYRWPKESDEGLGEKANAWWADETDPKQWEPIGEWPHLLIWISATSKTCRKRVLRQVRSLIDSTAGVSEMGCQFARTLGDNEEHFGFVDGISQPAIEGFRPGKPGDGKLSARGWQSLPVGEFIVGYRDEGMGPPERLDLAPIARDGTFLVYRKLEQDVEAFREMSASMAAAATISQGEIEEKIMGRHHDGTPLNVPPGAPDPPTADSLWNDFTYADDPDGSLCPFGSHVRRSNPRDDLHFEGRRVNRHRIIRRGMPYGEPYVEGETDDKKKRGLIFIAFNARIEDQFEFIQKNWLNGGRTFRLGDDADPIAGNGKNIRIVINGECPVLHEQSKPLTTFRGGDYFFVPSISMLNEIAHGT